MHRVLGTAAVQKYWVIAELYGVQNLIGVYAVPTKVVFSLGCRAALVHAVSGYSRAVCGAKLHRCKCTPKQAVLSLG